MAVGAGGHTPEDHESLSGKSLLIIVLRRPKGYSVLARINSLLYTGVF